MNRILKWFFCLLAVLAVTAGAALGEVYIEKERPADWEERDLLRIYALYALDCDSFVVECGGQYMLVDGGNSPKMGDLAAFLEAHGMAHLDIIYNSHPHDDHAEAMGYAVKKGLITADVFLSPFPEDYKDRKGLGTVQQLVVKALQERGIPYRQISDGDELTLGGAAIRIFRYDSDTKLPAGQSMTINNLSSVMRIRFGDSVIQMNADIGGIIQQKLAQDYGADGALRADIMTAPHHGKNAVNPELLKAVDPKLVIITGKVSRTGDCRLQLNRQGIEWKRTSYGTIVMETDGTDWYVYQEYPSEQVKRQEQQERKKK